MSRIALLCSEPLRDRMAGIGIRYLELARRLPRPGIEIVVVTSGEIEDVPDLPKEVSVRAFTRGELTSVLADCDGALAQGQLANDLLIEMPDLPTVIDLYDPWLVENLHYTKALGLDPYRNDHATWVLQMSRGDHFLCSSEEQRQFYLGFLMALGRINPARRELDPACEGLLSIVPFGVPDSLPEYRPVLGERSPGELRLLFGALYDWYDPATLMSALERLDDLEWSLVLIRHPDPEGTPQRLFAEVEQRARELGWWQKRIQVLPWQAADRRYDLLRDVDLLVATHRAGLETRLSLRTRFLDAFAAGCPVVTSEGGTVARLVAEKGAGWVVPTEDPESLASALREALTDAVKAKACARTATGLAAGFRWDRVLEPLVTFCRTPRADPTKDDFAFRPDTVAPADTLGFRARRWAKRHLGSPQ